MSLSKLKKASFQETKLGLLPTTWSEYRGKDLFVNRKQKGTDDLPVLSVTINSGLVPRNNLMRKMGNTVAGSKSLLVEKNDIAYNMMRMWQGAMGLAQFNAVVSPAYVVLRGNKELIDPNYSLLLLKSPRYLNLLKSYSYGLTLDRLRLYYKDFSLIPFIIPSVREQNKIVEIVGTWERGIRNLQAQILEKLNVKKEILHRCFVEKSIVSNGWEEKTFDEIFDIFPSKKYQIRKSDYLDEGNIPVVDQGKKKIIAYSNTKNFITDIPLIIFGDHTKNVKWIDFDFAPGADGTQVLKTKDICIALFGKYLLESIVIPNLGYSRHFKLVKEYKFRLPPKEVQIKLSKILFCVEKEIEILRKKVQLFIVQKNGLTQSLLNGKIKVNI